MKNTYVAQCPPSIKRSAPVMKELASERRNTTGPVGKRRDEGGEAVSANRAPATCNTQLDVPRNSSGVESRPSKDPLSQISLNSGFSSS